MQTFKCKICGGSLTVASKSRVAVCDYCGSKQILPLFSDESAQLLYDRGNSYLRQNEYDKAETIFNQLLSLCPEDPEIYWNLVLCKYGVTFVQDPKTGKYIPTCNRTHYESILNDKNYQKVIQYADEEQTAYYQENAETINDIQKGILAVSKKEKPFDIFISYKETDSKGTRTKDSIAAQKLYEKLTESGYKVFFSRITLEDKIGTEYEPYIYAALYSSKVMLTVCSSKENIESPWVRNEWSRFLTLRQNDASKTLIPLYFDMPKSDLPDEFAILAAQDMSKDDFEQELLRGIKKLIPLPIMLAARRKKLKKRLGISAAIFAGVILVAGVISFPYIKDYVTYNADYQAAMQLYNEEKYDEAANAFAELTDFKDSAAMQQESLNMGKYTAAMQLYYDGNYPEAAWAFRDMNGYKDSADMQKKVELAWREKLATVATNNILGTSSFGAYYISANGSVETFNYDPGTANSNISIDEHGNIVSIADNSALYALHEDGYVTNSKINNGLDSDWENIIQITPRFNTTNVALTNEGKVIYGNTQNELNPDWTDSWLQPTNEWTNIISLSCDLERFGFGGMESAALVGLKSDGTVVSVFYGVQPNADSFISSLKNIKEISVNVGVNGRVSIAALDKNGTLYTFADGVSNTYENLNIIDVETTDYYSDSDIESQFYILNNELTLSRLDSGNTIIEDAVYINKDFIVTRSGTIYTEYNWEGTAPTNTTVKTQIKDVWLDRS